MNITRGDFYCGAFLSALLNNGIVSALFKERTDSSRKIYNFITDKGDFRTYVKFSEKPCSRNSSKGSYIWDFPFTESQINEIKYIKDNSRKLYFIFICGRKSLNKSKIVIVPKDIIFKCANFNHIDKYENQSIKIRLTKGHWDFDIYGTARAEKINGHDNTIKIRMNSMDEFFKK